ncbi:hypothetical protein CRG98_018794 [Punica granatum]|uniref:Uncharacterized protein n=1 Tax=Punica granatum TaxID=22663 RepID=A0A2I0JWZ3_PUNGR|nr:hypothetical protein CRG98_018794 [Punica granatum]
MGHMLNELHCVLDEVAPILAGDAPVAFVCRLQGCGVVVAWGGCLLVCRKLASSLERFWIAGGRCLALWDSSSGEGAPTYPVDSGIRVCRSSYLLVIPVILAVPVNHHIQLPTVLEEVTHLGATPLNLKGKSSPFPTTPPKGFRSCLSFTLTFAYALKGVFDLAGSILLSLVFTRAKGSKDLTSECVVFCLHRGVVSAAPPFVGLGFILCPMSLFETPRLCIAEWPVAGAFCDRCPQSYLDISAVHASWMVHAAEAAECSRKTVALILDNSLNCLRLLFCRGYLIIRHPPCRSKRKRVRDKFSEKRELAHRSSLVANVPL